MIPVLGLCAGGYVHYINEANPESISLDEFHGMGGILRYFGINHRFFVMTKDAIDQIFNRAAATCKII